MKVNSKKLKCVSSTEANKKKVRCICSAPTTKNNKFTVTRTKFAEIKKKLDSDFLRGNPLNLPDHKIWILKAALDEVLVLLDELVKE